MRTKQWKTSFRNGRIQRTFEDDIGFQRDIIPDFNALMDYKLGITDTLYPEWDYDMMTDNEETYTPPASEPVSEVNYRHRPSKYANPNYGEARPVDDTYIDTESPTETFEASTEETLNTFDRARGKRLGQVTDTRALNRGLTFNYNARPAGSTSVDYSRPLQPPIGRRDYSGVMSDPGLTKRRDMFANFDWYEQYPEMYDNFEW